MPFDVIVMSLQKKFLSRRSCPTVHEAALFVQAILQKDVVGSLSIRRIVPKPQHVTDDRPHEAVRGFAGTVAA